MELGRLTGDGPRLVVGRAGGRGYEGGPGCPGLGLSCCPQRPVTPAPSSLGEMRTDLQTSRLGEVGTGQPGWSPSVNP